MRHRLNGEVVQSCAQHPLNTQGAEEAWRKAAVSAYRLVENVLMDDPAGAGTTGSTACTLGVLCRAPGGREPCVVVANCGDTRAVLGSKPRAGRRKASTFVLLNVSK